jgi:RimJ/RimL family protein N-acetyltransferase
MGWFTTGEVTEFLAEAGEFVRAEPARNTVILSVTENLRLSAAVLPDRHQAADDHHVESGPDRPDTGPRRRPQPGGDDPLFGWWRPGPGLTVGADDRDPHSPGAAFMHTPGFPVFLTAASSQAAAELAGLLASARPGVPGLNAQPQAADAFAGSWRQRTGHAVTVHRRMRLHCLGTLVWPDPRPEGRPRLAGQRDRDLMAEWFEAFAVEVDDAAAADHAAAVDQRLGYGGITVWEAAGVPVSVAGITRAVAGMVRVGPVYTPPALRGRGYAGGATAAMSQAALDAGAAQVVLYTDLANPTSNALYERLGYRPVEDRVVLAFEPRQAAAR